MPRALKPQKVDEVRHNSGITVELFLDRNHNVFYADVFKTRLQHAQAQQLKYNVEQALADAVAPEWTDVIQVHESSPFGGSSSNFFGFGYERMHVWQRPDGFIMTSAWHPEATSQEKLFDSALGYAASKDRSALTLPRVYWSQGAHRDMHTWMLYSEEAWEGLGVMQERLYQLKLNFRKLVSTDEGIARLEGVGGAKLLGSGGAVTPEDHARLILRQAHDENLLGDLRVAEYDGAWVLDCDTGVGPKRRYRVTLEGEFKIGTHGYLIDSTEGGKLWGVELTYIEPGAEVQALGGLVGIEPQKE